MFLKNYTSDVPVLETLHRIEKTLIKCGVSGITKEYGKDETVIAVAFQIPHANGKVNIRLPVDEKKAIDVLWLDYVGDDKLSTDGNSIHWNSRKKKTRADFVEQGRRTAWKIMQDWVEVQMSMIQMKQAETLEVFLPYVWDGQTTAYRKLRDSGFRALLPESTGNGV